MFTIRFDRRTFLRVGGVAGLSLPGVLNATETGRSILTGKSVIFLFQHGGPSQYETWDPKPDAPDTVRTVNGPVTTSVPGTTFGGLPKLATLADKFAVVRSFTTGNGNHDIKPIVGKHSLDANLGSIVSRIIGTTRPDGMPINCAIFPNAVDEDSPGKLDKFGKFDSTGRIGDSFAPFVPGAGGDLQQNLILNLPRQRLDDRRSLLKGLDDLRRGRDRGEFGEIDALHDQAFDVLVSGIADAFDVRKEGAKKLARYDTSEMVAPEKWKTWNNRDRYTAHAKTIGHLLLLARRLCEAGCVFVTISTDFVWDMHADKNNMGVKAGSELVAPPHDHAVATYIEDVEASGLRDRIMLVSCGEMGRSPKINKNGGRDHWGKLAPLMLYGGGVPGGAVIGRSTPDGGQPASEPITQSNLIATVMQAIFDIGELRLVDGLPADVLKVATDHEPIPGLI